MKLFGALILLGLSLVFAEKTRYDGYRLLKIKPTTQEHVKLLEELEHQPDFDVWKHLSRAQMDLDASFSPAAFEKYTQLFNENGINYEIINENIQNLIDEEERSIARNRLPGDNRVAGKYVSHNEINTWLEMMATANPSYLLTSNIGTTYEGRTLKTLIFRKGNPTRKVWFDCGIHAREWVSPSTCTYMIDKLVAGHNAGNMTIQSFLSNTEVHILPVVNPDGYEYSRSTSRLWRKNRTPTTSASCPGIDLNRNYGFQWMVAGASSSPCSDTYAGPSANSELETKAIQAVINSALGQWDSFVTIHSYGQWFLTPYGHTYSFPPDYTAQKNLAVATSSVIQSVYGMKFTSGSTSELLYLASGNSADWAYGTAKVKYSYTIELRPGSGTPDSSYGFILPEDRAPLVGEEIYQGMAYYLSQVSKP